MLLEAVADGVALIDWKHDGFAYAAAFDDARGRYAGLKAGERMALSEPAGLLVRPEVARKQLAAEPATAPQHDRSGEPGAGGRLATPDGEPESAVPTRFWGQVSLDPVRLKRDAVTVPGEVVAHLAALLRANVRVRLEIEADLPDGVPDDVLRTVTENARALRFDEHGFESDVR